MKQTEAKNERIKKGFLSPQRSIQKTLKYFNFPIFVPSPSLRNEAQTRIQAVSETKNFNPKTERINVERKKPLQKSIGSP